MKNAFVKGTRGAALHWIPLGLAGVVLCAPLFIRAQAPARNKPAHPGALAKPATPSSVEQPKFKAVWEPVNYNQDLKLTDVFFVTPEVGYVSGAAGTILKTTDGGKTWVPQLGGDPQSQEQPIDRLRFLDKTHGWAVQSSGIGAYKLLKTSDGESWEQIGTVTASWGLLEYQFLSPTQGLYLDGNANVSHIFHTADGGRTWKEVFPPSACAAKLEVQGLMQNTQCTLRAMHFASRLVGYAIGGSYTDRGALFIAKTEDGGVTWSISVIRDFGQLGPGGGNDYQGLVFKDENTGFANLGHLGGSQPFVTSDGGRTWHGLAASLPGVMKFADPEIGWAFDHYNYGLDYTVRYTSDGGTRWTSRTFHFPAEVTGFSLPRRDCGYVVGNHGMIYRYRVVPATYQAVAHSVDAPVMPGFDSPVFSEVATLNDVVAKLRTKLPAPSGNSEQSSGTTGGGSASTPGAGAFQQDTSNGPVASGYVDSCCGPLIQQLETTANSFAANVPTFSQRFRNLNLILEGLNLMNNMVSQANTLKQSIRALRHAPNQQTAALALSTVQTQVNGISSTGGFVQDVSMPPQP